MTTYLPVVDANRGVHGYATDAIEAMLIAGIESADPVVSIECGPITLHDGTRVRRAWRAVTQPTTRKETK